MNLIKKQGLGKIPHDLLFTENQKFLDKINPDDYDLKFHVSNPYPVEKPVHGNYRKFLKTFNNRSNDEYIKKLRKQFVPYRDTITEENVRDSKEINVPEFFEDYVKNGHTDGFKFSSNVLENIGESFIRPDINNRLIVSDSNFSKQLTLQWNSKDPILDIRNADRDRFLIRSANSINVTELIDSKIQIDLKLMTDIGYQDCGINGNELCIVDLKNQIKLIDVGTRQIKNFYDSDILNSNRILRFEYLSDSSVLFLLDSELKILDLRTKYVTQNIQVKMESCDTLLNFTLNSNEAHISSKHCYFIHDIRRTVCDEFIQHNLKFPPCFIEYIRNFDERYAVLASHSERAIFGKSSTFSLPFHLPSLKDTYESCSKSFEVPLVQNIEERLQLPIRGIKLHPSSSGIRIYYTNLLGDIFQQDVGSYPPAEEEMYEWLTDLSENEDPELNVVHFANASGAFNLDCEVNHLDLCKLYEESRVGKFLEDERFDYGQWDVDTFNEIWDDGLDEEINELETEQVENKVASWIERQEFTNNVN